MNSHPKNNNVKKSKIEIISKYIFEMFQKEYLVLKKFQSDSVTYLGVWVLSLEMLVHLKMNYEFKVYHWIGGNILK